ncbi:MAG: choice-of-anchor J domain-containing protein, partial [Candidatus Cloacimonetes bacterium]|nr:choice-of-anchor J domain-containing protein [Candidatus Cloacimonadota bacterium]
LTAIGNATITAQATGDFDGETHGFNVYFHRWMDEQWLDYEAPVCAFAAERQWKPMMEAYSDAYSFENFFVSLEESIPAVFHIFDNNDDSYRWTKLFSSAEAHSGEFSLILESNPNLPHDDWFVTPKINVRAQSTFSFWAKSAPGYPEMINLFLSEIGYQPTDLTTPLSQNIVVPDTWTHYSYDLANWEGNTVYIGIQAVSQDRDKLYIDDFELRVGSSDPLEILSEGFDTSFPPTGWNHVQTHASETWTQQNHNTQPFHEIDPTSIWSAYCPWVAEDQDEWLITPQLNLMSDTATLTFWAGYSTDWLENARLYAKLTLDNGQSWIPLWSAVDDDESWGWRYTSVDLSPYIGRTPVRIGFQYVGNDGDLVALDNVRVTGFGVDNDDEDIPVPEVLSAINYPNPFNPETVIEYNLPQRGVVLVEIFNIRGRLLDTLVSGEQKAGLHKVTWSGADCKGKPAASGVYFYRISQKNTRIINKMILIK